MTMHTDAAGLNLQNYGGWAGWAHRNGKLIIARGSWTGDIILDHSTTQELYAIYNTIQSFNLRKELNGKRILVKTDNQAAFYIINRAGSRDSHTHKLCKLLYWYCIHNHILLVATWIPRLENTFADFHSKQTDSGDWKLDVPIFNLLSSKWGPFSIDLLASYSSHQLPRYYSRFLTPTCEGVDAFNFNWGKELCSWCFPPFCLISKALAHANSHKARICFFCPFTPSAPWWPLLTSDGVYFSHFILDCIFISKRPDLLLAGKVAHEYTHRIPRWHFLALLIDFSRGWESPIRGVRIPDRA